MRRDGTDDAFGDLVLQLEEVVEQAFEALRPDMRPACRVDQLPGNAQPVPVLAHAAFEHIAHAQFLADALCVHDLALVGEARIARNDEQPADTRQGGDDVLHDAIGEILLLRIAAQVLEGQDGDRGFVRQDERRGGDLFRGSACAFVDVRLWCLPAQVAVDPTNEAVALAGDGAHQALLLTGITNGLAHRIDVAGDRRFRNDPVAPHRLEQLVLADDAVGIVDEQQQQIENLRSDGHDLPAQGQLPALLIEYVVFKREWQIEHPLAKRPQLRVPGGWRLVTEADDTAARHPLHRLRQGRLDERQ
ncbi:hypothetical protein D3C73_974280 [compost metagenome]